MNVRRLFFSLVSKTILEAILRRALDDDEFNSKFGIRSLSKIHEEQPYRLEGMVTNKWKQRLGIQMKYEPAETSADIHTGNSNWRGPVWFPVNYLLIDALREYHKHFGSDFKVHYPTSSRDKMTLDEVATKLSERLIRIFLKDENGNRPVFGHDDPVFGHDETKTKIEFRENWKGCILFHEYFHGDYGTGLGASHQTGWTALVANLANT